MFGTQWQWQSSTQSQFQECLDMRASMRHMVNISFLYVHYRNDRCFNATTRVQTLAACPKSSLAQAQVLPVRMPSRGATAAAAGDVPAAPHLTSTQTASNNNPDLRTRTANPTASPEPRNTQASKEAHPAEDDAAHAGLCCCGCSRL